MAPAMRMRRGPSPLRLLLLALFRLSIALPAAHASIAAAPLNVLMLVVDDLRAEFGQAYNSPEVKVPPPPPPYLHPRRLRPTFSCARSQMCSFLR